MCIATKEFSTTGLYRAVYFDGPQPDLNAHDGQCGTHPAWVVYIGDDEAEPVSHLQHFHSYEIAEQVARHLASARRLDLIHDASPA